MLSSIEKALEEKSSTYDSLLCSDTQRLVLTNSFKYVDHTSCKCSFL